MVTKILVKPHPSAHWVIRYNLVSRSNWSRTLHNAAPLRLGIGFGARRKHLSTKVAEAEADRSARPASLSHHVRFHGNDPEHSFRAHGKECRAAGVLPHKRSRGRADHGNPSHGKSGICPSPAERATPADLR